MKTLAVVLLLLAVCAHPLRAQNLIHTLPGDAGGDRIGWSVGTAGDVDGDSVPDLIAGAPRADVNGTSSGSARVSSGATGLPIWTFHGDGTSDQLGWAVDGVGDLDGDGRAELIAGAPFDDDNGPNAGLARVYDGATGLPLFTLRGDATLDVLGKAVAGAGDVDGDGVPDVIVGAPQENTASNGYARIYSGVDGSVIHTLVGIEFQSQFGISVAGLGDLDADGFGEVAVGAWLDDTPGIARGRVYVHSGVDGSVLHILDGQADNDWFGWALASAGDVNGDAVPDLIVGEYGADSVAGDAGRALVFSGADWSTLLTLDGETAGEQFGFSVGGAGDVNGDGRDDLVVGAPFTATGRARIFSGANGEVLLTIDGPGAGDTLGRDVAGLGDINADGHGDVLLGAPLDDDAGTSSGVITAVSGYWPWKDLGNGLPGTHGVPVLVGLGTLIAGQTLTLTLSGALENSSAALIIGLSVVNAPFKGGTLVPAANFVILGLPTDATGSLLLPAPWPTGAPSGLSFFFQDWIADPATPAGFSASNGLSATTP